MGDFTLSRARFRSSSSDNNIILSLIPEFEPYLPHHLPHIIRHRFYFFHSYNFFYLLFYPFFILHFFFFFFLQFRKFTFSQKRLHSARLKQALKKRFLVSTLSQLLIVLLFFSFWFIGVHGFINAMALFMFAVLQN